MTDHQHTAETTGVNIPLLRKAVEWAEAEAAKPPELCEWRQSYWVTPSTPEEAAQWGIWGSAGTTAENGRAKECGTCYCIAGYVVATQIGPVGAGVSMTEEAARLLGLDDDCGGPGGLFSATNTIQDVRRIAEELAGERL